MNIKNVEFYGCLSLFSSHQPFVAEKKKHEKIIKKKARGLWHFERRLFVS